MSKLSLKQLYAKPNKVVVTAHRGLSAYYPENTMSAFEKAIEAGADIIEFDIRSSKDGIPIIMHDPTIDRTTTGTGRPEDHTVQQLQQFNASCWVGASYDGQRHPQGTDPDATILTFEQLLQKIPENIGLNIQVYTDLLEPICQLYDKADLYGRGYLAVSTLEVAQRVRDINDQIDMCIFERGKPVTRDLLQRMADLGCWMVQPGHAMVDEQYCQLIEEMGFVANVFFANTDQDNRRLIQLGIRGILTDYTDRLKKTIECLGME